ncbi:unnamed protein product [Kuraishia capsulata CBS 1993]|uniref:Protein HRI1 n=1 Tax=Kuraishia capsulata CBS 1993 TaxID=1382522 RepID=W6MX59_9ASCO|nr:uncharacterized protein KUCA_T00004302001 [Kuraishia capsulata CBS 1993]CDK28320.1 unnamed protein product [Kuraishia capsulata CBS 1993]
MRRKYCDCTQEYYAASPVLPIKTFIQQVFSCESIRHALLLRLSSSANKHTETIHHKHKMTIAFQEQTDDKSHQSVMSVRISIQWPPAEANEETTTMVLTTPGAHYVDLRPLKNSLSVFPYQWNWAMAGEEVVIAENEIEFSHEFFNSMSIIKMQENKLKDIDEKVEMGGRDIGKFQSLESGDRREDGVMVNPDTGLEQPYIEIWRSLNPNTSTPASQVALEGTTSTVSICLDVTTDRFVGRYIRIGSWGQGVLWDKEDSTNWAPISTVRSFYNGSIWESVLATGNNATDFPVDFDGSEGDVLKVGDVEWRCVELV